jgi:hypothetical protein
MRKHAALRAALLPKLLCGKIRVRNTYCPPAQL